MKLSNPYIIAALLIMLTFHQGFAQDECELTLNRATEEFNTGHFYAIPSLLKDCLDRHQNPEWRQRAYLLLAETYLLLEDPIGAEDSYLKVLRANPEYLTERDRDPMDLVYLSKKFTATPIFSVYGKFGPNLSPVRVINDVDIGGENNTREKYYLKIGWHAGLGLDWNYNDKLVFAAELDYNFTAFRHRTTHLFGFNKDIVEFTDHQNWATIPILIKYGDDAGRLRPYGYLGYSVNFLLGDKGNIQILNRDYTEDDKDPITQNSGSPTLGFKDKRKPFGQSLLVGGGVKYKWKLDYFFVDLRYAVGLSNIVDPDQRYTGIQYRWPYVDDDFRMDNLSLSFGYVHPFYKPRKLKKARTRSILRKIKKEE